MGATKKTDRIAQLTAQVEALTSRLNALEAPVEADQNGNGHKAGPQTRRDLLKLAGAAAAGAAGTILLRTAPAAATSGMPVLLGNATTNDSAATTDLFPTTATAPSPLFQATGQGVSPTTTVPATASTTAPLSQSVPLIGAIGAGGALPNVAGSPDYPGFAPIQGVGGVTTIDVGPPEGTKQYSEGVNGYGSGATSFGVTGESDVGYGVAGGSGGIDIAALGHGRLLQAALLDSNDQTLPGPPAYTANDFEQVRDVNGILWLSKLGGGWRRINSLITVTPFRIFDTRPTKKGPNSMTDIQIAGVGGIPADAIGVVGNLTAMAPTADGFLTMFPKGSALNQVNSLNYTRGISALSNHVQVGLGTGGKVTVYVSGNGSTNFLFDVGGYII